ncbi:MAG: hypothetical protein M5U34_30920 [Chloroflexi bacterium]|nr:hypothetical protein [Chloroflexota bacterium]
MQVEPGHPGTGGSQSAFGFLQWFDPIPSEALAYIASDSILREFIGGSILDKFEIWRP